MHRPTTDTNATSKTTLDPAYIQQSLEESARSCRLQVFDPLAEIWRDIEVITHINDDVAEQDAYFWRFESSRPTVFWNMVEAFDEVCTLLDCFRPLRVAIVLNATGERIYESAAPTDANEPQRHPEFYVMDEAEWVAQFAEALATELPAQASSAQVIGKQLYNQHRHEYPAVVARSLRTDQGVAEVGDADWQRAWHRKAARPQDCDGGNMDSRAPASSDLFGIPVDAPSGQAVIKPAVYP